VFEGERRGGEREAQMIFLFFIFPIANGVSFLSLVFKPDLARHGAQAII